MLAADCGPSVVQQAAAIGTKVVAVWAHHRGNHYRSNHRRLHNDRRWDNDRRWRNDYWLPRSTRSGNGTVHRTCPQPSAVTIVAGNR